MRNEACPIQVMQSWPGSTLGKSGRARSPERLVKSVGISTSVRKLRFLQSLPGRNRTRVERLSVAVSSEEAWRTMFLRLFLGKGIGTSGERYGATGVTQSFLGGCGLQQLAARGIVLATETFPYSVVRIMGS